MRLLLPLFLIFSPLARADFHEQCLDALTRVFESGYTCGMCHDNVKRFMQVLQDEGIKYDPKKARVLYIFRPGTTFKAYEARGGEKDWNYHVVFQYAGKIYDFDYQDSPQGVRKPAFLRAMILPKGPEGKERLPDPTDPVVKFVRKLFGFRPREPRTLEDTLLDDVRVRAIPVEDYERDFPAYRNHMYYWQGWRVEKRYPSLPLRRFLGRGGEVRNPDPATESAPPAAPPPAR